MRKTRNYPWLLLQLMLALWSTGPRAQGALAEDQNIGNDISVAGESLNLKNTDNIDIYNNTTTGFELQPTYKQESVQLVEHQTPTQTLDPDAQPPIFETISKEDDNQMAEHQARASTIRPNLELPCNGKNYGKVGGKSGRHDARNEYSPAQITALFFSGVCAALIVTAAVYFAIRIYKQNKFTIK